MQITGKEGFVRVVQRKQVSNKRNSLTEEEVATHRERASLSGLCRGNRSATGRNSLSEEVATNSNRGACQGCAEETGQQAEGTV